MNKPQKIKDVAYIVFSNKPGFMAFFETKVKDKNVYKIARRVWRQADFITNNNASKGRILVLWIRACCDLMLVNSSDQQLTYWCHCKNSNEDFILTFIYARNTSTKRDRLWKQLKSISNGFSGLWIVVGDFDCVHYANEKF